MDTKENPMNEAEHFGDQETLNRLDAEWNAFEEDEETR
jgi:hypothetical protein